MFITPLSYQNSKINFDGKIGASTLAKAKTALSKDEYNLLKNFRAGKNQFTNIELERKISAIQENDGRFVNQGSIFAIISNKKKASNPITVEIGKDGIGLGRLFLARLSNAVINAEKHL